MKLEDFFRLLQLVIFFSFLSSVMRIARQIIPRLSSFHIQLTSADQRKIFRMVKVVKYRLHLLASIAYHRVPALRHMLVQFKLKIKTNSLLKKRI